MYDNRISAILDNMIGSEIFNELSEKLKKSKLIRIRTKILDKKIDQNNNVLEIYKKYILPYYENEKLERNLLKQRLLNVEFLNNNSSKNHLYLSFCNVRKSKEIICINDTFFTLIIIDLKFSNFEIYVLKFLLINI